MGDNLRKSLGDCLLGPFRGFIKSATYGVKNRHSRRRAAEVARLELLDQRVSTARAPGANPKRGELSDNRTGGGRQGMSPFGERERLSKPTLVRKDSAQCAPCMWEAIIDLQKTP